MKFPIYFFCWIAFLVSCSDAEKLDKNKYPIGQKCNACWPDSNAYYHYKKDTAKNNEENMQLGWVDTFSIDGNMFRLYISDQDENDTDVPYYKVDNWKQGKWTLNFKTQFMPSTFNFQDLNLDGFPDFKASNRSLSMINMYQPKLKRFDTSSWDKHQIEMVLLDTAMVTYYDWYMDVDVQLSSSLFTLKDGKPFFFYHLYNDTKELKHLYNDSVGLWKYKNGKDDVDNAMLIKKIPLKKRKEIKDFDYEKFWKENYKQLLKQYHK